MGNHLGHGGRRFVVEGDLLPAGERSIALSLDVAQVHEDVPRNVRCD
jgi:hypothetical protein